ncbi:bifunctional pyr operon transcriptional regulator/uracil phosphoribosyltransferase PyrR [Candidatus Aerophobetes bacterium]|nr:bifunctional pyr operon transcriptional regulator/uracil phosphoribosyltransferase PyrR [Candidatus Aerophobetes bacterium]
MKIMGSEEIKRTLLKLTSNFLKKNKSLDEVVIIGIQRRGATLASRISEIIKSLKGKKLPVGTLDITLYRDDLSRISYQPIIRSTDIPFSIDDKHLLLVDDVLYSGRTVRAALDALLDHGRPKKIELLVFVDRSHRELPIQADYVGKKIMSLPGQIVEVKLKEMDEKEEVVILEKKKDEI